MKKSIILLAVGLLAPLAVHAADQPLLAVPGKVIYENKFDAALGEPWKILKGKWELADGAWRAAEKFEDHHPGVARLTNKLGDFVIEYEFKFTGGKFNSLSINAPKGHMARILITPKQVSIQKDDSDHEGPDKAIVFAKLPADFAPGTWHKVRLEMVGDMMLGQVDQLTGWGQSASFKQDRTAGLTLGGDAVEFRNFKVYEATLNPDWDHVKVGLAKSGSKK